MELKSKKSWKDVSINDYFALQDIISDDTIEPADKEVELVSLLTGISEDDIWNMPITEFKKLQQSIEWVSTATLRPIDKILKMKTIEINGTVYTLEKDLTKFTVAQYIDFQSFWPNRDKREYIGAILCCFLIPKGKEYASDYDIQKTKDDIMTYLDIQTAYEVMGFFLVSWRNSTATSLDFLKKRMKRMRRLSKEQRQQMEETISQLRKATLDGFQLLTQ